MNDEIDKILEVIDNILDISNYVYYNNIPTGKTVTNYWLEEKKEIDNELAKRGLLKEDENIKIYFDNMGKINKIEKTIDVYEVPKEEEYQIDNEDYEISIKRKNSFEIEHRTLIKFTLTENEWKNYKRTKTIDKILNGAE